MFENFGHDRWGTLRMVFAVSSAVMYADDFHYSPKGGFAGVVMKGSPIRATMDFDSHNPQNGGGEWKWKDGIVRPKNGARGAGKHDCIIKSFQKGTRLTDIEVEIRIRNTKGAKDLSPDERNDAPNGITINGPQVTLEVLTDEHGQAFVSVAPHLWFFHEDLRKTMEAWPEDNFGTFLYKIGSAINLDRFLSWASSDGLPSSWNPDNAARHALDEKTDALGGRR